MAEKYNGWTNYETWAVNLWLTNDENTYLEVKERIKGVDFPADKIKELVEELIELEVGKLKGISGDLLNAILKEVNWTEIANSFKEE